MTSFARQNSFPGRQIAPIAPPMGQVPGVSVFDYIAQSNPKEVNSFLVSKGAAPSNSIRDLGGRLAMYVNEKGEAGLQDIMQYHPDKDVIMQSYSMPMNFQRPNSFNADGGYHNCGGCSGHNSADGFNNCSGCGGKCGGHNNASGALTQANNAGLISDRGYQLLALVSVVGLVGLFLKSMK